MMKIVALLASLAPAILGQSALAQENDRVRNVLQIPDGCYPVAINPQNEQITTVCRGQPNWSPDALQLFNQQWAAMGYHNTRTNSSGRLAQDMRDGVGPVPWFQYHWIRELDRIRVWRPQ